MNTNTPSLQKNPSKMLTILKKDKIEEEDSLENESDIDLSEEERKNDERQRFSAAKFKND